MNWNFHNLSILVLALSLTLLSFAELSKSKKEKVTNFFYWTLIIVGFSVLQLILIDSNLTTLYPWLFLLFVPFQLWSPVLFAKFTCWYLDRPQYFLKNKVLLLAPFLIFFAFFTFLNFNLAFQNYGILEWPIVKVGTQSYEFASLAFTLAVEIWNYQIVKVYEKTLGEFPYQIVHRKTKWIKNILKSAIAMSCIWASVVLYTRWSSNTVSLNLYYALWYLVLVYCCYCLFLGRKHLKKYLLKKSADRKMLYDIADNFQLSALNHIFNTVELDAIQRSRHEATGILSYFATSLFDKQNVGDVLWDIVENCIAKLQLEDCVIYLVDSEKKMLIQKAAFGNKNKGTRKILSPIHIPIGDGIVGSVARTGKWELVNETENDPRYILDDKKRRAELAVPIISGNGVIGVLDSEHSHKNFFQEHHVFLFQLIAKLTATKLCQLSRKSSVAITDDNIYFKELCRLLKEERLYRDQDLSLTKIAEKLSISPTYLSQLVNTLSDFNFSDFINLYRVEDSKAKLTDSNFAKYTIHAIGLEAGFNSRSTFYEAFKKHTGMTPSQFRKNSSTLS